VQLLTKPLVVEANQRKEDPPSLSPYIQDLLFLSIFVALCSGFYIHQVGFYSIDWHWLSRMRMSPDQSFLGAVTSLRGAYTAMRPMEMVWWCLLYKAFALNPLGFHVTNAVVSLFGVLLLYGAARQLGLQRLFAVVVALLYAVTPLYCTDHFWLDCFTINVSVVLCLLSLNADLYAITSGRFWLWRSVSLVCVIVSLLSYEIAMPLFVFNQLLLCVFRRSYLQSNPVASRRGIAFFLSVSLHVATIAAIALFKLKTTMRLDKPVPNELSSHLYFFAHTVATSAQYALGPYGLELPKTVFSVLRHDPNIVSLILAASAFLLCAGYVYFLSNPSWQWLTGRRSAQLLAAGMLVFVLGYSMFLTNSQAILSPAGMGNRVSIVAAFGAAMVYAGLFGLLSCRLAPALRRITFACLVGTFAAGSMLIDNRIASCWISSWHQQLTIARDIKRNFPSLPKKTILMLDGVNPYVGPAVVFESPWDLSSLLVLVYRDPTLRADIVTKNLAAAGLGLTTSYLGLVPVRSDYAYSSKLLIYNYQDKKTVPCADATVARSYLRIHPPSKALREVVGDPAF
jgi:hypothetical protein